MKRLFATITVLALLLSFTPALAADVDVIKLFPAQTEYTGFSDVSVSAWYASAVAICCETGMMNGTGSGFNPDGTLTLAEVVTISARIYATLHGETVPAASEGAPWYEGAQSYLTGLGVSLPEDMEATATRTQFFDLLSAVVSENLLRPINSISTLPDTTDETVLTFYNAGILTGIDEYGTFAGENSLTRAEAATMVARLIRPWMRQEFILTEFSFSMLYAGVPADTVLLTVNDLPITSETYLNWLYQEIYYMEYNLYTNYNQYIDFSTDYGVGDLNTYLKSNALFDVAYEALLNDAAAAIGCDATLSAVSAALYPSPSKEDMEAYVTKNDLYYAKHILFSSQEEAESCLALLKTDPTQFDALMNTYSEDTGLSSYPNGYLYQGGAMVEEFETAVQSLAVGEISDVVTSPYGYHIILRLDPTSSPDFLSAYQQNTAYAQFFSQAQNATFQCSDLYNSITAESFYSFLASMQKGEA